MAWSAAPLETTGCPDAPCPICLFAHTTVSLVSPGDWLLAAPPPDTPLLWCLSHQPLPLVVPRTVPLVYCNHVAPAAIACSLVSDRLDRHTTCLSCLRVVRSISYVTDSAAGAKNFEPQAPAAPWSRNCHGTVDHRCTPSKSCSESNQSPSPDFEECRVGRCVSCIRVSDGVMSGDCSGGSSRARRHHQAHSPVTHTVAPATHKNTGITPGVCEVRLCCSEMLICPSPSRST